jgi:patatin-like phospholipase/acyl hydrolase
MPTGLTALCIDAGGCRGSLALLVLRHLLHQVEPSAKVDALRPCNYFDLICGSSASGIIALMLGPLQMTLGETIEAFDRFTRTAFSDEEEKNGVLRAFLKGERYPVDQLQRAVMELLESQGVSTDQLLFDPNLNLKSYVCPVELF